MTPAMDFRDELLFLAVTVAMEAANQPDDGKLAVAFVICNRDHSVLDAIFQPYQFSAWNTKSVTRMNLDQLDASTFRSCYRAACLAYFAAVPDPSKGATHYLNPVTVASLNNGEMPAWYDPARITATIGDHEFLRLA